VSLAGSPGAGSTDYGHLRADRDSGTTDYAIELPLTFQEVYHSREHLPERLQQPSSRASALLTGCFPYL
jgi:hypothetical protein